MIRLLMIRLLMTRLLMTRLLISVLSLHCSRPLDFWTQQCSSLCAPLIITVSLLSSIKLIIYG